MNSYISGSKVRESAQFTGISGVAADPDTITLKYRAGDGSTQTVANPTKDATGSYHYDIDTSGWAGPDKLLYTCQWSGTGAVQAIGVDYFQVTPPAL